MKALKRPQFPLVSAGVFAVALVAVVFLQVSDPRHAVPVATGGDTAGVPAPAGASPSPGVSPSTSPSATAPLAPPAGPPPNTSSGPPAGINPPGLRRSASATKPGRRPTPLPAT